MRLSVLIFSVLFVIANKTVHAQELMIHKGDNSWRELSETPAQRAEIRTVIIKGSFSKHRVKKLISALVDFPSLTEVRIVDHKLTHIPAELNSCMNLKTLAVSYYSDLDVDSLFELCATMPQLDEVYIGLFSMADYPEVPAGLSKLDTLVFFGPEILIGHAGYTLTSMPEHYMRSRYDEDLSEGLLSVDMLPVVCLFPREELDVSPSWTFQPSSATLAGIGLYAGHKLTAPVQSFCESLRKYDHVHPPAAEWITPHEAATINPAIVNVIDMSTSNTRIIIPENAFVLSDGTPVNEPVTILFKEYRDPLDFVLSGIPMSFPQDSSMAYFSSAGMFDIQGVSEGKEVFIDEGKTIEVSFASTTDADGFNFWRFDDSTGQWQDLGANTADQGEEVVDVEFTRAQLRYSQLYKTITRYSDPTPLQERFESTSYTYIRKERKEKKTFRLPVGQGTIKIDRMVRLRKVQMLGDDKDIVFNIGSYAAYHPEMLAFRNCRWHLQEGMNAQDFRRAFAGRNKYSDVRLVNHGEFVEIRLKKGDEILSVNATPVTVNGKRGKEELSSEMKRYSVYSKRLAKRQKHFNKRALKNQNAHDRMPVNDPKWKAELCYARVKRFMKPEEKRLTMDEWLDSYYANRAAMAKSALNSSATESGITRMLTLSGFGIYNVDILRDMSEPVIVRAEYTLDDKPIDVVSAYAISLANNSMIAFNGSYGYSAQRLKIEPLLTDYLLTIHKDRSISVVLKEELERELPEKNGKACFEVQHFEKKEHTVGDVREALGLH